MTGIVHKATKVSGEKGLATEWNDDHKQTGNHDCEKHQHLNHVIENRNDFPAGPVEGQIIYRTDLNAIYVYDGTGWSRSNKRLGIWSCGGVNFTALEPDTDDIIYSNSGPVMANVNGINFLAPVSLPHGAVVTAVKCWGGGGAEAKTWFLVRYDFVAEAVNIMAMANFDVEDNTIAFATIDNENYEYHIWGSTLDAGNWIGGTRIKYIL